MPKKILFVVFLLLSSVILQAELPHKDHSVLSSGRWFKLAVTTEGIHRIGYEDLSVMGIDVTAIDPARIRLFGNGSGMLPEKNSAPRIDDLREVSLQVTDGGDGSFDPEDYFLFFGESPDKWSFDKVNRIFIHQKNLYSDTTFYFLNFNEANGKRVHTVPYSTQPPNFFALDFDDFSVHETDQVNLIRSGKEWYGEVFDNAKSTWEFPFYFPNIDSFAPIRLKTSVAAKSSVPSYFFITYKGTKIDSVRVELTDPADMSRYCKSKIKQTIISWPRSGEDIGLSYSMPLSNSIGWLNYLEVNCVRKLYWEGPQMPFRNISSAGTGRISEFYLRNATSAVTVWDITDPSDAGVIQTVITDSLLKFRLPTDTLRQFIAFDGSWYLPVIFVGEIPNQDLHASVPAELTIITHPDFIGQATRLADYHRRNNGLSVLLTSVTEVYNEFGGGSRDVTAIRDFMKLLYDKAEPGNKPAYLLLVGDGSYDPKNRIPGNNNFIPTFQSLESLSPTSSYVTDDYFGIMGDSSGQESNGPIDIGVGRFPVSTSDEARIMVDKIIHYSETEFPVTSGWRNTVTFVADDENQNLHFHHAEELTEIIAEQYPFMNVKKIYFDSYLRETIPGGYRFPDATRALNEAVEKGSLLINYTGHGGESGWSYEQVLTMSDIEQWTNYDKLPVFLTATCEFSRFDNPERYTAGEMVILHPNGGAVALFSTTRLAYAGQNIKLNTSFVQHLMDKDENGAYLKMGDLIRLSKNLNSNNTGLRNFVLLGDPAQTIAFAKNQVKVTEINGLPVSQADTVMGLSTVTINGRIEDGSGQKVNGFNGHLEAILFDKPRTYSTLGNIPPPETYPEPFSAQDIVLFRGNFPVTDGTFQYSFVVPRDVALNFGRGKLSHYAWDTISDASGYSDQIVIGGTDPFIDPGNRGPDMALYLNSRNFIPGDKTNPDPILIADLADTNGINFVGLGIGHEIEYVLDQDRAHAQVLNDYFTPEFNSATKGTVIFPMKGLAPGEHHLALKAWDMFNNSSEKEVVFYVSDQLSPVVRNVVNAPNPMFDHTWFLFCPDQYSAEGIDVMIQIYDITGRPVRTINTHLSSPGNDLPDRGSVYWDGTDLNGNKLSTGIYPYRIVFRNPNGTSTATSQKLMIIR